METTELENLHQKGDFEGAIVWCQAKIAQNDDQIYFWRTQLGYVYFLNEQNLQGYYDLAPAVFQQLVNDFPKDTNALFWLAYLSDLVLCQKEMAQNLIQQLLALNPLHPYANLISAGWGEADQELYLLRCLQVQPYNFRALKQLAHYFLQTEKRQTAGQILQKIVGGQPYFESNYGLMNTYINEVLTGFTQAQEIKLWASNLLQEL